MERVLPARSQGSMLQRPLARVGADHRCVCINLFCFVFLVVVVVVVVVV